MQCNANQSIDQQDATGTKLKQNDISQRQNLLFNSRRAAPSHQEEIYYWERIVIARRRWWQWQNYYCCCCTNVHNRIHYNNIQRIHLHLQRRPPQPPTPSSSDSTTERTPARATELWPGRRQGWWTERNGGKGHPFESAFALPQFYCRGSAAGRSVLYVSPSSQRQRRPTDRPKRQLPLYPIHRTQSISISCSSPSLANNFLFYFGLLFLHLLVGGEEGKKSTPFGGAFLSDAPPPSAISNSTIEKRHAVAGDCKKNRQDKTNTSFKKESTALPEEDEVNLKSK